MELKEGDIFRWSYKDNTESLAYWAKSRIAIVQKGWLRDTYWMHGLEDKFGTSDGAMWSLEDAVERLELAFIANIADLKKQPHDQSEFYDDADVVNLNHANSPSGNWYLRKGAQRSREKMLETARYKREKAVSKMIWAADDVRRLDSAISTIERGEALEGVWIAAMNATVA